MALSSTCSSLKSLIIMNVGVDDAVCFQRSFKVSSSSSPIVTEFLDAFKISHFTSLLSLEPSLLSQNSRGGLDASGLI
jgi:hypothetical protein